MSDTTPRATPDTRPDLADRLRAFGDDPTLNDTERVLLWDAADELDRLAALEAAGLRVVSCPDLPTGATLIPERVERHDSDGHAWLPEFPWRTDAKVFRVRVYRVVPR